MIFALKGPSTLQIFTLLFFFVSTKALASQQPAIDEWFALGSGCRAKHNLPGNVQMKYTFVNSANESDVRIIFYLPNYNLNSAEPINVAHPTFARECALRAALKMPQGKRVRSLRAASSFEITKETDVKLKLASQMHLGNAIVASKMFEFAESRVLKQDVTPVHLFATSQPFPNAQEEAFPKQDCGADKLLGLDTSITNWRTSSKPKVLAKLSEPASIEIDVKLENCQ